MLLMRMRVIALAFSCATSSLTLTASVSLPALPQAAEQRASDAKQDSSGAEANKKTPTGKDASDPEAEPFEHSEHSLKGLSKRFLGDQEQIWTSPARLR